MLIHTNEWRLYIRKLGKKVLGYWFSYYVYLWFKLKYGFGGCVSVDFVYFGDSIVQQHKKACKLFLLLPNWRYFREFSSKQHKQSKAIGAPRRNTYRLIWHTFLPFLLLLLLLPKKFHLDAIYLGEWPYITGSVKTAQHYSGFFSPNAAISDLFPVETCRDDFLSGWNTSPFSFATFEKR